jgi:predicted RNase H-like HicB family nuclease
MKFVVHVERETDGRWIGEIADLPGALAYGKTRKQAIAAVEALAFRVLADRLEHGEARGGPWSITFEPAA